MKRLLLAIPLLVFIPPVNAFWGLSEEEKNICRDRASRERNEFSAKQRYNYCSKNIKSELKEKERKKQEYKKNYDRWYKEVGQYGCEAKEEIVKKCDWELKRKCREFFDNPTILKSDGSFEINICPHIGYCLEKEQNLLDCKERIIKSKKEYGL